MVFTSYGLVQLPREMSPKQNIHRPALTNARVPSAAMEKLVFFRRYDVGSVIFA
jgi:hypothetical protein